MAGYDTAQICLEGHIVNSFLHLTPNRSSKHCNKCGAETMTTCRNCSAPIRGGFAYTRFSRQHANPISEPPCFCEKCGKPYPWTESRLEAARTLADQLELDVPERTLLEQSIDELIRDTAKAPAEAVRFKAIVEKAKPWGLEAFKLILGAVVREGVKQLIWPA